jgi:hypothetical protein
MVTLGDIFRQYGPQYLQRHADRLSASQRQALHAIAVCRTEALGGHVYRCAACGEMLYSYHSCRNRHCPQCQHAAAQRWLQEQQDLLLPVPYFLLTFTLPAELRSIAQQQPRLIYNLLFRASAAAAQELARDPRFIGGQLGLIGILQTWARNLTYHPHIHYLVPSGGWDPTTQTWRPAHPDFLLPVKALSVLFRAKFRDGLRKHPLFQHIPASVWPQDWVVHCLSVGTGAPALKYLAPYVFQVAISNKRIVSLENDQVSFIYTDARTRQRQTCTLDALAFIDRFLQHVLPKGFCKVRYYGCFSPSQRTTLQAVRHWFAQTSVEDVAAKPPVTAAPPPAVIRCPKCQQPMAVVATLRPTARCPPPTAGI